MRRVAIVALACASACFGQGFVPTEDQVSHHREAVFDFARDYVVETFNLTVIEEGSFNPVRFNAQGVWGSFDARLKELGGDRFEVKGWVNANGHEQARVPWSVIVRYPLADPEAWRYTRLDELSEPEPEFLGWKFGAYYSLGYDAAYSEELLAEIFAR